MDLKIVVEPIFLGVDTAIPCGLIINELMCNSVKHAFPEGEPGQIQIDLHAAPDQQYVLTVRDNGVGFPRGLDFRNTESLGLQIVIALTRQLEGAIELTTDNGTAFTIRFGELHYKQRG